MSPSASKENARNARRKTPASAMSSRRGQARALVSWAAKAMKTPLAEVKGPSRLRSVSRVRAVAGFLGREVVGVPIARVAEEVERDPSTLWRDVRWLEGEMKRDRELRSRVSRLEKDCAAWVRVRNSPRPRVGRPGSGNRDA
jgi:chromosomal replication initiation ATPase DnaA